jgi:fatty-acyl-CoA synthase
VTLSHRQSGTVVPLLNSTVGDLLRGAAAAAPDRPALVDGTPGPGTPRQWTYAELLDAAEIGARDLLTQFDQGQRIAVWGSNSPEWLILQHAAALAGLTVVTINPAYRYPELEFVLRHSGSVGIFHAPEYRGTDLGEVVTRAVREIDTLTVAATLSDWMPASAGTPIDVPLPAVDPGDVAMVQYTSGTTGRPKGVLVHHRGMVNSARFVAERAGVGDGVFVNPMPSFHIGSCGAATLGVIHKRGTQVIMPRFDAAQALELIERHRARAILAVPTMLLAMLEHPDLGRRDMSSLDVVLTGGSTVSTEIVRRVKSIMGAKMSITFGQTETCGPSIQTRPDGSLEEQVETVGPPLPHTELKIVDPVTSETVPLGAEGEICTRGPMTMIGYLDGPNDTGTTGSGLTSDGWLHYGDIGWMDAEGLVRITGRVKEMIIRGGENIAPREIEETLVTHPLVADVAVVGVPDPKWGEQIAAVVRTSSPGDELVAAELDEYCRSRLASFKVPVIWEFVSEFPMTMSGKIQKFKLRQWLTDSRGL